MRPSIGKNAGIVGVHCLFRGIPVAQLVSNFIWFLIFLCSANRRWKRKWLKKQRAKSSDHPSAASTLLPSTAPSAAVSALPAPWIAIHDSRGRVYYANTQTSETLWARPLPGAPAVPTGLSGSNSESDFSINSGTLQLTTLCSLFHPLMQAMAGGAGLRPAPSQTTGALKHKLAQLLIVQTSLQLTVRGGRQPNQFYREYWIRPRGSGPLPRKVFLRS